jgi:hypothetical protein
MSANESVTAVVLIVGGAVGVEDINDTNKDILSKCTRKYPCVNRGGTRGCLKKPVTNGLQLGDPSGADEGNKIRTTPRTPKSASIPSPNIDADAPAELDEDTKASFKSEPDTATEGV